MNLRDYQITLLNSVRAEFAAGARSVCMQAPTGSGKTAIAMAMLHGAVQQGHETWFLVHRRELLDQAQAAADKEGVKVNIGMVQTVSRHLDMFPMPKFVVWDECAHACCDSYDKIRTYTDKAWHVGLTATPCRLDGKGLKVQFERLVIGPAVAELIEQGWLSPFKVYAPATPDMTGVHTLAGDYKRNEMAEVMNKPYITGNALEHYQKLCPGKQTVIFCASIAHSRAICDQFAASGIATKHVDGETPTAERREIVEDFRSGKVRCLTNVELFGEGFDLPAIEAAILLRPTKSLGLHLQQIGRTLRPQPGKTAIILDHAGNCQRLGLPDETFKWTLDGITKRDKKQESPVRICPQCLRAMPAARSVCPECGTAKPVEARQVSIRSGSLVELTKRQEQGNARNLEGLVILGKIRGYRNPRAWAMHVMEARYARGNR